MKEIYDEAQLLNATEREQFLKGYGLRNVEVTFQFSNLVTVRLNP
jgi:hypothetical protein